MEFAGSGLGKASFFFYERPINQPTNKKQTTE